MTEHVFNAMDTKYKIIQIPDTENEDNIDTLEEFITDLIEQDFNSFSNIEEFHYCNLIEVLQEFDYDKYLEITNITLENTDNTDD